MVLIWHGSHLSDGPDHSCLSVTVKAGCWPERSTPGSMIILSYDHIMFTSVAIWLKHDTVTCGETVACIPTSTAGRPWSTAGRWKIQYVFIGLNSHRYCLSQMATDENIYDHLMYDHRSRGRPFGPTPRLHSYRQATVIRTITEMGSMSRMTAVLFQPNALLKLQRLR